jgi:diaminohydroxyphosphoribosylaminopyrimidine deaminase/5-amino-6-(5-phosphoribosylamino)uracil reductase
MPYLTKAIELYTHEHYMRMALSFAMRGSCSVSPNPKVGCALVDHEADGGRLIAWGYHRRFGDPHAEVEALRKAGAGAEGCTAYVNLEPCCHTGKTPPCSDALIEHGIRRVVIGTNDPNPLVSGGGTEALRSAGIEVISGVLEKECRWVNRGFIRRMTMGRPWVTVKAAVSLDGKIALENGESRWISGYEPRKRAHLMRAESDAIMAGVGTVLKDDPMLTVRNVDGHSPVKVIVDMDLRTSEDAKVLEEGKCVFFTGPNPDKKKAESLTRRGVSIIKQKEDVSAHIPMDELLSKLCGMGVNRLLVEGGAKLISSLAKAGLVDEFSLFIAPKILGRGISFSDGISFSHMGETISLRDVRVRKIGGDIWLEGVPECSPAL